MTTTHPQREVFLGSTRFVFKCSDNGDSVIKAPNSVEVIIRSDTTCEVNLDAICDGPDQIIIFPEKYILSIAEAFAISPLPRDMDKWLRCCAVKAATVVASSWGVWARCRNGFYIDRLWTWRVHSFAEEFATAVQALRARAPVK